jgi:hypothetical protein
MGNDIRSWIQSFCPLKFEICPRLASVRLNTYYFRGKDRECGIIYVSLVLSLALPFACYAVLDSK